MHACAPPSFIALASRVLWSQTLEWLFCDQHVYRHSPRFAEQTMDVRAHEEGA